MRGNTMKHINYYWRSLLLVVLALPLSVQAVLITGPGDPNYTTPFQGASAATFAGLGFTIGTGAGDLKVDTGTFVDPAGLTFGTALSNGVGGGSGFSPTPLNYNYGGTSMVGLTAANARDYHWLQNTGSNSTTNPANDSPWRGTIWDLGGQANQAAVFPIVDHGPLPQEVVEYTVYLGNNPTSTSLSDWTLALLDTVFMQGWQADSIAIADGFTTVWKLPGNQTFRYVSVEAIGSQAIRSLYGNEDEIDAVAGLTVQGGAVGTQVPEPASITLLLAGLIGLGFSRRLQAS